MRPTVQYRSGEHRRPKARVAIRLPVKRQPAGCAYDLFYHQFPATTTAWQRGLDLPRGYAPSRRRGSWKHSYEVNMASVDGVFMTHAHIDECARFRAECAWLEARRAERIRDRGKALAAGAKIANNKQLEIDATEIRIRAEHRLGQMLAEQKRTVGLAKGGQPYQATGSAKEPVETPTLADSGIEKKLSMRAQKL